MARVIALIDMDCFYVQVEQRSQPQFIGRPCAVVQYKTYKGGGIIAVNYEARALGVSRNMMGDDAKKICPEIYLFRVPILREKADLTKYRDAGAEVINALHDMHLNCCIERASVDEAYIDLSAEVNHRLDKNNVKITADSIPNTVISGVEIKNSSLRDDLINNWLFENVDLYSKRLIIGALIVEEMRAFIFETTKFKCSAGISHNKILAKLACGLNKPNKQTLLTQDNVPVIFANTPIKNVRKFGGKFGLSITNCLKVNFVAELIQFPLNYLAVKFGEKNAQWIFDVCRGIENEPVQARQLTKSIGCSKNFFGNDMLEYKEKIKYWLKMMADEISERLIKDQDMNRRTAQNLTTSLTISCNKVHQSSTRTGPLRKYNAEDIADLALQQIQIFNTASSNSTAWYPPIVQLGISAGKFTESSVTSSQQFKNYFQITSSQNLAMSSQNNQYINTINDIHNQHNNLNDFHNHNNIHNKSSQRKRKSTCDINHKKQKSKSDISNYFRNGGRHIHNSIIEQNNLLLTACEFIPEDPLIDLNIQTASSNASDEYFNQEYCRVYDDFIKVDNDDFNFSQNILTDFKMKNIDLHKKRNIGEIENDFHLNSDLNSLNEFGSLIENDCSYVLNNKLNNTIHNNSSHHVDKISNGIIDDDKINSVKECLLLIKDQFDLSSDNKLSNKDKISPDQIMKSNYNVKRPSNQMCFNSIYEKENLNLINLADGNSQAIPSSCGMDKNNQINENVDLKEIKNSNIFNDQISFKTLISSDINHYNSDDNLNNISISVFPSDIGTKSVLPLKNDNLVEMLKRNEKLRAEELLKRQTEDWLECEKCRRCVSKWELSEHMDYHLACELQSQFNSTSSSSGGLPLTKQPATTKRQQHKIKKKKVPTATLR